MSEAQPDREALIATLTRQLADRPEIVFAFLHGSFLAGPRYRDIDIAVWVDPSATPPTAWARYALDLGAALSRAARIPVDVRLLNSAPLSFRYHAQKGQLLLGRDPEVLADFRARTWDEYFDFLPFARQYLREALRG
jgi:predicted nucleotidyltransferase